MSTAPKPATTPKRAKQLMHCYNNVKGTWKQLVYGDAILSALEAACVKGRICYTCFFYGDKIVRADECTSRFCNPDYREPQLCCASDEEGYES